MMTEINTKKTSDDFKGLATDLEATDMEMKSVVATGLAALIIALALAGAAGYALLF